MPKNNNLFSIIHNKLSEYEIELIEETIIKLMHDAAYRGHLLTDEGSFEAENVREEVMRMFNTEKFFAAQEEKEK